MKRIAVVYDNHPDHPRIKTTGFFIEKAFKKLKEDGFLYYDRFFSKHQNALKEKYFDYDFVLYIDDDQKYRIEMDKRLPIAYWCFDIHREGKPQILRIAKSLQSNVIFVGNRKYVNYLKIKANNKNVHWLPFAADYPADNVDERQEEYNWCFVGTCNIAKDGLYKKRVNYVNHLKLVDANNFVGKIPYEEVDAFYRKSKIALNISELDELNMRIFEIVRSKSFLFTNRLADDVLNMVFKPDTEAVSFKNPVDMIKKYQYYIRNPEQIDIIRKNAFDRLVKEHLYEHRIKRIVEIMS